MATSALHVTFLWKAVQPSERMIQNYSDIETELSLAIDDADLFGREVGEDVINTMNMFECLPKEGTLDKRRMENALSFCAALAEVYLTVPAEKQPTLTDTLYKTGVTDGVLAVMRAGYPALSAEEAWLYSAVQMCCSTLLISLATRRAEEDITRTKHSHQRLCRRMIPVLQHVLYHSPCLATVLVQLKHLLIIASTHKSFFNEILEEFGGVVEEFLKPGVLIAHWNTRIPPRQSGFLKALTPYMPGEINCFVNILSWFIYEIPVQGMVDADLDKVMARDTLLAAYWRLLNEPVPSTYFRFAKSKVILLFSALCERGDRYCNQLREMFGVCEFLEELLGDVEIDDRSYFPLSCLVRNMIICTNPLHPDNLYPMDKAMELIYEEYGKGDVLIQTEALQYLPGTKKSLQVKLGKILQEFASQLAHAFGSEFTIKNVKRKVKTEESMKKSVRFGEDVNREEKDTTKSEGILASSVETKQSSLEGYLEHQYGAQYTQYLATYAQNGLYLTNKRNVFYNCLSATDRVMLELVCTVCNAALNKVQCPACSFKYCSGACLSKDAESHKEHCSLALLERSLREAVVS